MAVAHAQALRLIFGLAVAVGLTGCSVVALPFRAAGAVVKVVPVAGPVAAAPLDATAHVID